MSDLALKTSTSFTLLMSMIGASLLSASFIIFRLGAVFSFILLTFTIVVVLFLMRFFLEAVYYTGCGTYRELAEKILGRGFSLLLDFAIDIQYFGFMTAYIIIAGNSVQTFIHNVVKYDVSGLIIKGVISLLIVYPLTMLKSLSQLSKIASIAGIAIFITAISIVVYFFISLAHNKTVCTFSENDVQKSITFSLPMFPKNTPIVQLILIFLQYVPSFISNFSIHNVVPNLFNELKGPLPIRKQVIWISILIADGSAMVMYALCGFLGAWMFGDDLKDNILLAFAPCKFLWIDILSILYSFVVIIAFPIVLFPIKVSLVGLSKHRFESRPGYWIAFAISTAYVLGTMGLAMVYEGIVSIFGLFASFAGYIYIFVLPFILVLRYPQLKADNADKDLLQGYETMVTVDPVSVAVLSLLAPAVTHDAVNRARRMSTILFGAAEVVTNQDPIEKRRALSILRQRTYSVKQEDDGTVKLRTYSIGNSSADDVAANVQIAIEDVENPRFQEKAATVVEDELTVEEILGGDLEDFEKVTERDSKGKVKISLTRKIVCYGSIAFFTIVCVEGIIMNGFDIIKSFLK